MVCARRRPADWKPSRLNQPKSRRRRGRPPAGEIIHPREQSEEVEGATAKRRRVEKFKPVELDAEFGRGATPDELAELMRYCGLPKNYPSMTLRERRDTRLAILRGWYDKNRPGELIADFEKFLTAVHLWREFYMKPAEVNRGTYIYKDPTCLDDMIRDAFHAPLTEGMPSRCALAAARQLGKTRTFVHDIPLMIAVCRPFTKVLVAQLQGDRTAEELRAIKYQVQENERIQADFGGKGLLYPGRGSTDAIWTNKHLQFIHQYNVHIMGYSVGVSQRGRGPILIVVDDVDTGKVAKDVAAQRAKLINLIFSVFLKMLKPGSFFILLGSVAVGGSCIELALRGLTNLDGKVSDEEGIDHRFDDWVKVRYGYMIKDKKGEWQAVQPERYSVATIQRELEHDYATTAAEWMCESVTPGDRSFNFNEYGHGYMHCADDVGREYMLDLSTWAERPWEEFRREIRVVGAGDIASGRSAECDCSASVFVGADAKGIIYVLDVFNRRCTFPTHVETTYSMAESWDCLEFGWEKAALQVLLTDHLIQPYIETLRAAGKTPPVFREMDHEAKKKTMRTLAMSPLFNNRKIRFLHFDEVRGPDGKIHRPVDPIRRGYYDDLKAQIKEYTDKGLAGLDDACDALEMAVRLLGPSKGEAVEAPEPETAQQILDRWAEVGLKLPRTAIPLEKWPKEWWDQARTIQERREYCAIAGT